MHLTISILVILVTYTNAISLLTGEWTENVKQFLQETQQKISQKSNQFLTGWLDYLFNYYQKEKLIIIKKLLLNEFL